MINEILNRFYTIVRTKAYKHLIITLYSQALISEAQLQRFDIYILFYSPL